MLILYIFQAKAHPDDELETAVGVAESTDESGLVWERLSFTAAPGTGEIKSFLV